ncbi:MAG: MFS transporter [Caldilineales bacterium]|nr:MFS transporter [Caldilineales bacterium]
MAATAEPVARKFGPLRMMQGVTAANLFTYYVAAVTALLLFTFLPQFQPFLLTEFLGIPESRQGAISGYLTFFGEIVILVSIGGWGTLSDKTGRKFVFAMGFLLMGLALFLYPYVTNLFMLFMGRGLFALGSAAVTTMLATVIADYVVDEDRGKASGIQGIGNGIGALLTVFVVLQLPKIFMGNGMSALEAGRLTYWLLAGVALVSAAAMAVGLQNRTRLQKEQRKGILQISKEGFAAAKDPGVALAYMAAFISRGDLAIVGTFFTLWVVTYGTAQKGMPTADALALAGIIIGISQTMALITAPIFGILADRMNRANAVIFAVALASFGYGSTLFVADPTGPAIFLVAALIGMGEISGVIASGVLIAQQAPRTIRGSVIGIFSLCGTLGIMTATGIGGELFDHWMPQGPFVLFSLLGWVVVVIGLLIRHRIVPLNEQANAVVGH